MCEVLWLYCAGLHIDQRVRGAEVILSWPAYRPVCERRCSNKKLGPWSRRVSKGQLKFVGPQTNLVGNSMVMSASKGILSVSVLITIRQLTLVYIMIILIMIIILHNDYDDDNNYDDNDDNNIMIIMVADDNNCISDAPFHMKHAQLL